MMGRARTTPRTRLYARVRNCTLHTARIGMYGHVTRMLHFVTVEPGQWSHSYPIHKDGAKELLFNLDAQVRTTEDDNTLFEWNYTTGH